MPALTNTVHLLSPTTLSTVAPTNSTPLQVLVGGAVQGGKAVPTSNWKLTLPNDVKGQLNITLTLVVDVEGNVYAAPILPPNTNMTYCFWHVSLFVGPAGGSNTQADACFWEQVMVPTGIRTLQGTIRMPEGTYQAGDILELLVTQSAAATDTNASIAILTDSMQYDSSMALQGQNFLVGIHHLK